MKKTVFLMLFAALSVVVQGQGFRWVQSYTGSDGTSERKNDIKGSCVDSEGNIYIFGSFSPEATLCGERLLPQEIVTDNSRSVMVAKLSPAGELVWHKAIYTTHNTYAYGFSEVGDSAFMIMIGLKLSHNMGGFLYYLDTLLTAADAGYLKTNDSIFGNVPSNAFITFDHDGNVLEQHIIDVGYIDTTGLEITCNMSGWTPPNTQSSHVLFTHKVLSSERFKVDGEGNIYLLRRSNDDVPLPSSGPNTYNMLSIDSCNLGALKIVVDGRRSLIHNIDYGPATCSWNYQIMKFSPHFDSLLGSVYLLDSIGIYHHIPTLMTHSLKIDAQNNLYWAIECDNMPSGAPIANSNSLRIGDSILARVFVLRYHSDLYATDIVQFEAINPVHPTGHSLRIHYVHIDEETNSVFFSGNIENASVVKYGNDTLYLYDFGGYWLRVDRDSLRPMLYAVIPGHCATASGVAAKNNRVFAQLLFYRVEFLGSTTTAPPGGLDRGFAIWDYEGHEIAFTHYNLRLYKNRDYDPLVVDSIVYLTGVVHETATFGNITVPGNGSSRAFVAQYVDTSFMTPYVYHDNRPSQTIYWNQTMIFSEAAGSVGLTAVSSSGLPVSYTCSDPSVAYVDGTTLHLVAPGHAVVTASQAGNRRYRPATPVSKQLDVYSAGIAPALADGLHLFPNPAKEVLHIALDGHRIDRVELFSALGQQVDAPFSNSSLDLSHLPAGIYLITIFAENTIYKHKIIKL